MQFLGEVKKVQIDILFYVYNNTIVNDWICKVFDGCEISSSAPIIRSSLIDYEGCGFGRVIELKEGISLNQSASFLKQFLKLSNRINFFFYYLNDFNL